MNFRIWTKPVLVAAVVLVTASIAGCAGPSPLLLIENVTSPQSDAEKEATSVAYWLPADTDLSALPADDPGGDQQCSVALSSWLSEHGSRVLFPQQLRVTNATDEAVTVSLSHTESSVDPASEPGFYVQCGVIAPTSNELLEGEIEWTPIIYNISDGESKDGSSDYEKPYEYTLAPGETAGVILYLNGADRFQGELQLVAEGTESIQQAIPVLADEVPSNTLRWPGIDQSSSLLVHPVEGELYCVTVDSSRLGDRCTAEQITAELAAN